MWEDLKTAFLHTAISLIFVLEPLVQNKCFFWGHRESVKLNVEAIFSFSVRAGGDHGHMTMAQAAYVNLSFH